MATSNETMEYILEVLNLNKVTTRKMFGEYALYYDKKVVAFICDNTIFLKITPRTTKYLGGMFKKGNAYKGSKNYYIIDEEINYYIIDEEIIEQNGKLIALLELCSLDVKEKIKK